MLTAPKDDATVQARAAGSHCVVTPVRVGIAPTEELSPSAAMTLGSVNSRPTNATSASDRPAEPETVF